MRDSVSHTMVFDATNHVSKRSGSFAEMWKPASTQTRTNFNWIIVYDCFNFLLAFPSVRKDNRYWMHKEVGQHRKNALLIKIYLNSLVYASRRHIWSIVFSVNLQHQFCTQRGARPETGTAPM